MSDFVTITDTIEGIDRADWLYPAADKNTLNWWFRRGPEDVNSAIDNMAAYTKGWRTCIQAGGAIGVWPLRLSQVFDQVITFEPEAVNYACLLHNTIGVRNIYPINCALGSNPSKKVRMGLEPKMIGHCGAWQVMDDGDIPVVRIDDLNRDDIDLIYLDVEGSEYDAIAGASRTIESCRPVIGLENKGFNRRYNNGASAVDRLISQHGYRVLCKPNPCDVMLVPSEC